MLKKIKLLLVSTITMVTLCLVGNVNNVLAGESNTTEMKIVAEGYTEDGGRFVAYETITYEKNNISPRIVVSKEITMHVTFTGHITPPSTMKYDEYDKDYDTQMKGTLQLQSYIQDTDFLLRKETRAIYKGTVFGNI